MANPGLSIIIASSGRESLQSTIDSIVPQLTPSDELLVDVNDDAPWGHKARNRMMPKANPDNGLCFIDDDDTYRPDALSVMRIAFHTSPEDIHMFRMQYMIDGHCLWVLQEVVKANVSTQMFVVPFSIAQKALWSDEYHGDFDFITEASKYADITWHTDVIVNKGTPRA